MSISAKITGIPTETTGGLFFGLLLKNKAIATTTRSTTATMIRMPGIYEAGTARDPTNDERPKLFESDVEALIFEGFRHQTWIIDPTISKFLVVVCWVLVSRHVALRGRIDLCGASAGFKVFAVSVPRCVTLSGTFRRPGAKS